MEADVLTRVNLFMPRGEIAFSGNKSWTRFGYGVCYGTVERSAVVLGKGFSYCYGLLKLIPIDWTFD